MDNLKNVVEGLFSSESASGYADMIGEMLSVYVRQKDITREQAARMVDRSVNLTRHLVVLSEQYHKKDSDQEQNQ